MAAWFWVGCLFMAWSDAFAKTSYTLDLGAFGDNLQQRLAAAPGYATQVSTLSGFVRVRPMMHLTQSVTFEPSFAVLVPWRSGYDGFAKAITSFLGMDFGFAFTSWLKWRIGSALQWNVIWGQGNAVSLNNGTGTTTFYTPEGFSNGFVFLAETGLEFRFTSTVSLGVELWVSQLMNASNRRFMGAAYFGIYL